MCRCTSSISGSQLVNGCSRWAEEAAVQSGAELGAAGQGLDPLVRDWEAFTSSFCKRGIRGEGEAGQGFEPTSQRVV